MAKKRKDFFEKWIESGEVENKLAIAQSLSMQGQTIKQIAEVLGISCRTMMYLQKEHSALKKAIDTGRLSVVAMCQNKLMEKVAAGDTTAIIYALKVYGGDFFNDRKLINNKVDGNAQAQVQIYLPETDKKVGDTHEER